MIVLLYNKAPAPNEESIRHQQPQHIQPSQQHVIIPAEQFKKILKKITAIVASNFMLAYDVIKNDYINKSEKSATKLETSQISEMDFRRSSNF